MTIKSHLRGLSLLILCVVLAACGGSSSDTQPIAQVVPVTPDPTDTIAPVITIIGSTVIAHEQGSTYSDLGATANDNVDGSVTVITSGTVTAQAGEYSITYTAVDAAGNSASASRLVTVSDSQAPVITLVGNAQVTLVEGESYAELGASAIDVVDGEIDVSIVGSVGTLVGVYTLTYSAVDTAGNQATANRTVNVIANVDSQEGDLNVLSQGVTTSIWNKGINAFDAAINFGECNNDDGAACPSIAWQVVSDNERGQVLEVTHSSAGQLAGLFIAANGSIDMSDYAQGNIVFDVKVVSGDSKITMKIDCNFPCTSGDQNLGSRGVNGWETVTVSLSSLVAGGLDLSKVNTGLVIWASNSISTVFRIDNVRFTGIAQGASPPTEPEGDAEFGANDFTLTAYGAGNISNTINPASYRCVVDFGNWIYNAGVVAPGIDACNANTGIPTGTPTRLSPQLTGPAAQRPTPTHKWWGSIPFMGEMTVGDPNDAAYITPDPITARVTEKGVRIMGIPSGIKTVNQNEVAYQIPDPFSEVMDGIAIANSLFSNLEAFLKDHSDGSVTVEWQSDGSAVMEATFVHGSPYVYFKAIQGEIVIRALREDGGEKGTFYNQDNHLGVWTSVAGNHNNYLLSGEGDTTFTNITSNEIKVSNATNEVTVTYLPHLGGVPTTSLVDFFATKARSVVESVLINYTVNRSNNDVTVTHKYLDNAGMPVETLAGMHPLHWKNSNQLTTDYKIRSARGVIKFAQTSEFSYTMPYVGILPTLPFIESAMNVATLATFVDEVVNQSDIQKNEYTDTYWSGKRYGRIAEVIAIADQAGMSAKAEQLRQYLKRELEDWFTANTTAELDTVKYFVYDETWNTLLGLEESFSSHQQLNDHHFHYGYFVRAAAEVCRTEPTWCSNEQFGPMIELLIRDYAGGRNDDMFPYLRNFDPANGFSWASGNVNFARGNNNESTSEAANAYGAIVLYGLITGNDTLTERGMYLHASTSQSYWQYWNNIDGYNNIGEDEDNFLSTYNRITTSILWGDGAVFSTWFSPAFAHILGIQGLPINPLVFHVGLYSDYMADYVTLGLFESANSKPSGLPEDQWRDVWWNLWAMTDAEASLQDYNAVSSYNEEAGDSRAHTYHWLHSYRHLGRLITGSGSLFADHPAAVAFEKNGTITYVVYNFSSQSKTVTYSNQTQVTATANGFTLLVE